MRVSKVVKEHIAKKVMEVYNPRINDIDVDYKVKKEEVLAKMRSCMERAEEEMKAIIKDNCEQWNFEVHYGRNILSMSHYIGDSEAENNFRIAKDNLRAERDEKIENIIVELELGGNKETLERLLAEL
jgi:hypothetical protein